VTVVEKQNQLWIEDLTVSSNGSDGEHSVRRMLDGITLTISAGEWINVAGVNGSGKTTLARIIAGLTVEGAAGQMERGFAGTYPSPYVMQHPDTQLFGETPREEIRFTLEWLGLGKRDVEERTEAILQRTALAPLADLSWEKLSGGQRQLAAIAAAIAGEAPLIVFDEASSMLDEQVYQGVKKLAHSLNAQGTAIVWVTQRLHELEPASRVVALKEGRIGYDGDLRAFLFGQPIQAEGAMLPALSPCEECGLRLPYLASLAREWARQGKQLPPLPVTAAEWREVLAPHE